MLYSGLKSKRKLILIFSFLPYSSIYFNPLGPVRGPKDQKLSKLPKTLKWMIRSGLSYINFKKIIFQIFLPFFLGGGDYPHFGPSKSTMLHLFHLGTAHLILQVCVGENLVYFYRSCRSFHFQLQKFVSSDVVRR